MSRPAFGYTPRPLATSESLGFPESLRGHCSMSSARLAVSGATNSRMSRRWSAAKSTCRSESRKIVPSYAVALPPQPPALTLLSPLS